MKIPMRSLGSARVSRAGEGVLAIANFSLKSKTPGAVITKERSFRRDAATSSLTKGETLLDTARNLDALHTDILVLRHSSAGAPHFLATRLKTSVINAGDGAHEHPTQALLDLYTIREKRGRIDNLHVAI